MDCVGRCCADDDCKDVSMTVVMTVTIYADDCVGDVSMTVLTTVTRL